MNDWSSCKSHKGKLFFASVERILFCISAVQLQNIAVDAKKDKHLLKELCRRLSLFLTHALMKRVLHTGPSPGFFSFSQHFSSH